MVLDTDVAIFAPEADQYLLFMNASRYLLQVNIFINSARLDLGIEHTFHNT